MQPICSLHKKHSYLCTLSKLLFILLFPLTIYNHKQTLFCPSTLPHTHNKLLLRYQQSVIEIGREEGVEIGKHRAKLLLATNIKKSGVANEVIAKYSGLTLNEIAELRYPATTLAV